MPSIGGILNAARTALIAQQAAMQVTGQNIANASVEGYSRQSLVLIPSTEERTSSGSFGTGVTMRNVTSARDVLLAQDVRSQNSPAAAFKERSSLLGSIEGVFGEPSTTGLGNAMDAFWNSWSDLASNPTNAGSKTVVQQRGAQLASMFNSYANQIDTIASATRTTLTTAVQQVGILTKQIAGMNGQIVSSEANGTSANDLRDARDRLIDQLSQLVTVTVFDRPDGSDQISLGGMPLVDGTTSKSLSVNAGTPLVVSITGNGDPINSIGGRIGAMLDVVNTDIVNVQSGLDSMVASLIQDVNRLQYSGWSPPSGSAGNFTGLPGATGSLVRFFDDTPANVNAKNFRLHPPIAANADAIATGTTLNGRGDNSVALAISSLRNAMPSMSGGTLAAQYSSLVSGVAGAKLTADDSATVSGTMQKQATQRKLSATGVNTDDELVQLMRQQQAYAAAAKVIQAVDQMSQVLMSIKQ
jgi:flagellar hook-associated protein 1 FlgK